MGQAWCKEKSTKAQDSKSPLDRVFLRCAHRIYPALKEEGSVLGGATQRVTSSEIGYASSPPREVLTRGQSIDSVDRPFHPSDWVDVNLEVPGTPRATSAMTNLTLDTTLYPSSTLPSRSSGGSTSRDSMPIPPPRRRRKNRGRPLPPKPDQVLATHVDRLATPKKSSKEARNRSHEHLYSSVKSRDSSRSNKMEIYEHKVNGTGRVIPSTVVAGNRSNREKSSRRSDDQIGIKCSRPKNSSTVSLPNYSELDVASEKNAQGEEEEVLKIHKITSAESLPVLITSGAIDDVIKSENHRIVEKSIEPHDDEYEIKSSIDEVDFSFDVSKNLDTLNYIYKLKGPRLTSTPVKNGFENDSRTPTTVGGWLHQDRDPKSEERVYRPTESNREKSDTETDKFFDCTKNLRNDTFFEDITLDESEDNRGGVEQRVAEPEPGKPRRRSSLKRTLSNESEPFDSYEEKELRETASTAVRSNSRLELVGRSISEESLPEEMIVDRDPTNPLEDDGPGKESNNKIEKPVALASIMGKSDDTKTPPPSPEPKIKPDIFDNDHSTLLKVLRDEAEESNLSSMTPSLTELEAALSDMLERDDENQSPVKLSEEKAKIVSIESTQADRAIEAPIEPKIVQMDIDNDNHSRVSVSLKNILGGPDDRMRKINSTVKPETSKIGEIDPRNGGSYLDRGETRKSIGENSADDSRSGGIPTTEPPEKPCRLHQINVGETSEVFEKVPTPPRRRNRGSVGAVRDNFRQSIERAVTPENPYPNDRLI